MVGSRTAFGGRTSFFINSLPSYDRFGREHGLFQICRGPAQEICIFAKQCNSRVAILAKETAHFLGLATVIHAWGFLELRSADCASAVLARQQRVVSIERQAIAPETIL